MATIIERFEKLRNEMLAYSNTRTELVTKLNDIRSAATAQKSVSDRHQNSINEQRKLLLNELPTRIEKAVAALELPSDYKNTFISAITKELKNEIEHNLSSRRFALIDSDNILQKQYTDISNLEADIKQLDKSYKQTLKEFEESKRLLTKHRNMIAAKLSEADVN